MRLRVLYTLFVIMALESLYKKTSCTYKHTSCMLNIDIEFMYLFRADLEKTSALNGYKTIRCILGGIVWATQKRQ